MFCRSWRPNPTPGHNHAPGTCRVCWKVCWGRPDRGDRCEDCLWALAKHPSSVVRRQLVVEPDLPDDVLDLLATDFDATVQAHALKVIGARSSGGPVLPADLLDDDRAPVSNGGYIFEDLDDDEEGDLEPAGFGRWHAAATGPATRSDDRS